MIVGFQCALSARILGRDSSGCKRNFPHFKVKSWSVSDIMLISAIDLASTSADLPMRPEDTTENGKNEDPSRVDSTDSMLELISESGKTFDTITQNIKASEATRKSSLTTSKEISAEIKIKKPSTGTPHAELSLPIRTSASKARAEFSTGKYHEELNIIQAKLDLISSTNLIESYGFLDRHAFMQSRSRTLNARTRSLLAELNDRKSVFALASRLISGDGLDATVGRLDRDVMWFVAELKFRQLKLESEASPAG